jgi:hypothetical protein
LPNTQTGRPPPFGLPQLLAFTSEGRLFYPQPEGAPGSGDKLQRCIYISVMQLNQFCQASATLIKRRLFYWQKILKALHKLRWVRSENVKIKTGLWKYIFTAWFVQF